MASINVTIETEESEWNTGTLLPQKVAKRAKRMMSWEEKRDIPDLFLQGKRDSFVQVAFMVLMNPQLVP